MKIIRGRVVEINSKSPPFAVSVLNIDGTHKVEVSDMGGCEIGDLVEVSNLRLKQLTQNRSRERSKTFPDRILSPRIQKNLSVRQTVENEIRKILAEQDFIEVRTPLIVTSPGMETHIRPFEVYSAGERQRFGYLHTSPEFAMKKLLAGGLERIFQICPVFRSEPLSKTHRPEFTMLEFYEAHADYEGLMEVVESLFSRIAGLFSKTKKLAYDGSEISYVTPWPRLRVYDLFLEIGVDLKNSQTSESLSEECKKRGIQASATEPYDDLYFKLWLNLIEPKLPKNRPVFVIDYLGRQAALSKTKKDSDGFEWAKRFEIYAGGLELGNAFEELTDPEEQLQRFEADMRERENIYGHLFPRSPVDPLFIEALREGIPPSSGIAIGVDRLCMLFADETDIDQMFFL